MKNETNNVVIEELQERLEPRQAHAAQLMVANEFAGKGDKKTLEEIAEEVGVTRQTLHNWKTSNIAFIEYLKALSTVTLDSQRSFVDAQLMKLIAGGNNGIPSVKGVELYYKLTGALIERQEVISGNAPSSSPKMTRNELASEIQKLSDMLR
ncbi:hypothetical protein BC6307_19320 [Sutcliffiella cohnii]|uniref:Homeodomain phBC6A51-type domain-containing protein n=1 Tax=Sutcliffiella cohnii TaxID=33932 RepID=A0A223KV60_9BACI|nr:phBC6A51 family helix-turn-helix protein [Sutcliffiella cohnii]AST93253.1 hypothetical protein BC6307_19320 [Sutcliffiella cohnii]